MMILLVASLGLVAACGESADEGTDAQPAAGSGEESPLTLDAFTIDTVEGADFEAIGCWLRRDTSVDPFEPVFFTGFDGGLIVVDDEVVALQNDDPEAPEVVFDDIRDGTSYSGGGYTATFTMVSTPEPTSIEATDQGVVLEVSGPDGRSTAIDGVLGCGV